MRHYAMTLTLLAFWLLFLLLGDSPASHIAALVLFIGGGLAFPIEVEAKLSRK